MKKLTTTAVFMIALALLATAAVADTETLRPDAQGSNDGWQNVNCGSGSSEYQCVDEATLDTNDYLRSNNGDQETFSFANSANIGSGDAINSVTLYYVAMQHNNDKNRCFNSLVVANGSDYLGSNHLCVGSSWENVSETYTTNPATGSAWTLSEVNALEAGMQGTEPDGGGRVAQVYAVVDYTADLQPTATADATPLSGESPLNVSFTGSASGGDGAITYFWEFGDGFNSTLQNPSHVYTTGLYTATLTVTDADNDFDSDSVTINVTAPGQPDLTVTNLFYYEFNVGNQTWVNATATVENIGSASAGSSTLGLFAISLLEQFTQSLAPSQSTFVTFVYQCSQAHNVSAFADWGFDITESNEANQASAEQFVDCIV